MAKKHMVKCLYCGQEFDAANEPFEKPRANRYAHVECYQNHNANLSQEDRDHEMLVAYIKKLFNGKPNPRAWKQIVEFKDEYGYTYSGMLKTLQWWYELKHNDIEKANGAIGIIPFVYDEACQYYYTLYLALLANENKDVVQYVTRVREFTIEEPKSIRPAVKLFNLDDEEKREC